MVVVRNHGNRGNLVQDLLSNGWFVTKQMQDGVDRGAELELKFLHTSVEVGQLGGKLVNE